MKLEFDVAVVGGGPAGMMAAASAAKLGARTVLLEKEREAGQKADDNRQRPVQCL